MRPDAPISSPANERLKKVRRLRRARHRHAENVFLIEGYREVRRAVDAGVRIRDLLVCRELWTGRNEQRLTDDGAAAGAAVSVLTRSAFASVAEQDDADGVLAVAARPDTGLARQQSALDAGVPLFVVAEGIERPGNLGTIARTCAGAGVDGVIVCDPQVDPFHHDAVRASVGTLFALPLSIVGTEAFVGWAHDHHIRVIVSTPSATVPYDRADVSGPTALVVGSEKRGASEAMLAAADERVVLPMTGAIDSINVAMAATVLAFDALRQRRAAAASVGCAPHDDRRRDDPA